MKIPRDLSGRDLIKTLCRKWGYRIVAAYLGFGT